MSENSPEVKKILLGWPSDNVSEWKSGRWCFRSAISKSSHNLLCWSVPPPGHHGPSKKKIIESGSSPGFPHPKSFDKNVLSSIILTGSGRIVFCY